jgi:ABC-type sugar transport system ATPase subunit
MSEDDIITMMVGRELTALYPSEPTPGRGNPAGGKPDRLAPG